MSTTTRARLVLVMVGKPARGKSYTARKIVGYLRWLGRPARVFNVGAYRRERLGAGQDHTFFDPDNPTGKKARRRMAQEALDDMLGWLGNGGDVGIYDATNSTVDRRAWVQTACQDAGHDVVFVELVCDDPRIIEANIRATKVTSPDYEGKDPDLAVEDFRQRLGHYERMYQPVGDQEGSFIRVVDAGRQLVANRIHGYVAGRLVTFLLNVHLVPRPIYLTRHGESMDNVAGRIGGDTALSPRGEHYAETLGRYVEDELGGFPFEVWTSTLARTVQTASAIGHTTRTWRVLDEIDAGVCDGMTYAQIAEAMPDEYAARRADKFRYRYPRGESYQDVIARLEPVIFEVERVREPVLIVAHQAVLRALYAYFQQIEPSRCPNLEIPLHAVIRLVPGAYGCHEQRIPLGPPTVPAHS